MNRNTSLHRATAQNKIDVIKFLIENKANLNIQDSEEKTALHNAALNENKEIVEILIKAGASNEILDCEKKKPSDYVPRELRSWFDK